MITTEWKISKASSVDGYVLKNQDGTTSILDGVIVSAWLTCTVTKGTESKSFTQQFPIKPPVEDNFTLIDNVKKEDVLQWCMDSIHPKIIESFEKSLINILDPKKPTIIFEE